jgi:hypothetical protein
MALVDFLKKKIGGLEERKVKAEAYLVELQDKFTKAEAKRAQESGMKNYSKWSQIFQNLETDLDRTKALISKSTAELKEKRLRLAEEEAKASQETAQEAAVSQGIMDMSVEELGDLSFEEIARLQEVELKQAGDNEAAAAAAKAAAAGKAKEEKERQQEKLEAALDKALQGDAASLTLGEISLVLNCYAEQAPKDPNDAVLKKLGELLGKVDRVCAAFRAKWGSISGSK